uniref:Uncharacterized protein n=1 Tax=Fagus sylvatica TaxID=28930 RepID=A0A2N9H8U0_FAGSY
MTAISSDQECRNLDPTGRRYIGSGGLEQCFLAGFGAAVKILRLKTEAVDLAWRTAIGFGCDYDSLPSTCPGPNPSQILLASHFRLGVAGVAASSAASNLFALLCVVLYVWAKGIHVPTWCTPSRECFTGWKPLVRLAAPSCVSVCLEWWWYEIMIVLCGLLTNPKATVASMGVLIQTMAFIYVFPSSLSFAVSTRVGNELGGNRPYKAKLSVVELR